MPDKILNRIRNRKMKAQNGLCYYCEQPMWIQDIKRFCVSNNLTDEQARSLKCTAEHLIARRDDGLTSDANIVAACFQCNQKRHDTDAPMSSEQFKIYRRRYENQI